MLLGQVVLLRSIKDGFSTCIGDVSGYTSELLDRVKLACRADEDGIVTLETDTVNHRDCGTFSLTRFAGLLHILRGLLLVPLEVADGILDVDDNHMVGVTDIVEGRVIDNLKGSEDIPELVDDDTDLVDLGECHILLEGDKGVHHSLDTGCRRSRLRSW